MEEKILIESKPNEEIVGLLKFLMVMCFFTAFICVMIGLVYYINMNDVIVARITILIAAALVVFGGITVIIYFCYTKCKLTITEKNIKGKALFGKEVVLPMHMISAFSTRKWFSTIAIASASGFVKFSCIKNYREIGEVLSSLINNGQENTNVIGATSNLDELKKLKEFLDSGIITQEEFDAKKKQILGL